MRAVAEDCCCVLVVSGEGGYFSGDVLSRNASTSAEVARLARGTGSRRVDCNQGHPDQG
jgi:hypothetical protein